MVVVDFRGLKAGICTSYNLQMKTNSNAGASSRSNTIRYDRAETSSAGLQVLGLHIIHFCPQHRYDFQFEKLI